jgi:hypothetical protein
MNNYKIVSNFLSKEECDRFIEHINEISDNKFHKFSTTFYDTELTELLQKKMSLIDDSQGLWPATQAPVVGPRLNFIKYQKNSEGIKKHVDSTKHEDISHTCIVYLNDNYEGKTVLYKDYIKSYIVPETGKLLMFDINTVHAGKPTIEEKYILIFRLLRRC